MKILQDYNNEEKVVTVLEQMNRTVGQNLEPEVEQHIYRSLIYDRKL